jgi:O-antigen ligase
MKTSLLSWKKRVQGRIHSEKGGADPVILGFIVFGMLVYVIFIVFMDNMKADRDDIWGSRQKMIKDRRANEERIKRQLMFPRGVGYTTAQKYQ